MRWSDSILLSFPQRVLIECFRWRSWALSAIRRFKWSSAATSHLPGQLMTSSTTLNQSWVTPETGMWPQTGECPQTGFYKPVSCVCVFLLQSWLPALCQSFVWDVIWWEESLPSVHHRLLHAAPRWPCQPAPPPHHRQEGKLTIQSARANQMLLWRSIYAPLMSTESRVQTDGSVHVHI